MSSTIWKATHKSQGSSLTVNLKTLPTLIENQAYQLQIWSTKTSASIPISNWRNKQVPDPIAPKITINLIDEPIQSTGTNPSFVISFADSSGLAWLNSKGELASIVVDDSIRTELAPIIQMKNGSAQLAEAKMRLNNLKQGKHKISAFCWDVYNNYSQQALEFQVTNEEQQSSTGKIYPNPLSKSFHFVFEQDKPWNRMPYEIELINMAGQVILRRTGYSDYLETKEGIIAFDWSEDEWQKMNPLMIIKISLQDELQKEMKIFRIKTSTLK
jgi:hypothetical protein